MKKYLKFLMTLLLAALFAVGVTACTAGGEDMGAGPLPAYLTAETEERSEARVLYEEAQREGFRGTFLDFLATYEFPEKESADPVQTALRSVVRIVSTFSVRSGRTTTTVNVGGAGVIWSYDEGTGDMLVITNYHVVYNSSSVGNECVPHISDRISLWLYGCGGTGEITANFYGGAKEYDIALLTVSGEDVVTTDSGTHTNLEAEERGMPAAVSFADSDDLLAGEKVYAVGNPDGEGIAATEGSVSVEAEYIDMAALDGSGTVSHLEIRTDAAVNHGNSGGGLFNGNGALVGIVNARSEEDGVVAFGYAIPSNLVAAVVHNLIDNEGVVKRAMLGVTVSVADSYLEEEGNALRIREELGVVTVSENGAAQGKLEAGDVIVSVTHDGKSVAVDREHKLTVAMLGVRSGDTVVLTVRRGGATQDVSLTYSSSSYFEIYD